MGESVLIGGDIVISLSGIPLNSEMNFEKARLSFHELATGDTFTIIVLKEDGKKS